MGIADWMLETVDRAAKFTADLTQQRRGEDESGSGQTDDTITTIDERPRRRPESSLGQLILRNKVGDGHRNEEDDVARVDRSLARLDFRPAEKRDQPDSFITRGLDTAIKLFQKAHNLKVDGWLAPGGETEEALNNQLALKQKEPKPTPPSTTTIKKDPEPTAAPAPASKSNPDADPERDATEKRVREPAPAKTPEPLIKGYRDEDVIAEFKRYEQPVPYIYKDTKGNLTVGVGLMMPSVEEAKKLPFYVEGKDGKHRQATASEIEEAVKRVQSKPHGQQYGAGKFDPKKYPELIPLYINDKDADALLIQKIREHAESARRKFPKLDQYPAGVQLGTVDMDYNMGPNLNRIEWPGFYKAMESGNFEEAAKQSHRSDVSKERNDATAEKFRQGIPKKQ